PGPGPQDATHPGGQKFGALPWRVPGNGARHTARHCTRRRRSRPDAPALQTRIAQTCTTLYISSHNTNTRGHTMKFSTLPRMLGLCAALSAASLLSAPAAVAGPADQSITVGMGEDFPTLDGYINTSRDGVVITMHINDMLIYRNPT